MNNTSIEARLHKQEFLDDMNKLTGKTIDFIIAPKMANFDMKDFKRKIKRLKLEIIDNHIKFIEEEQDVGIKDDDIRCQICQDKILNIYKDFYHNNDGDPIITYEVVFDTYCIIIDNNLLQ